MIQPQYTHSSNVEVLLAPKSGTILVVDAGAVQDQVKMAGSNSMLEVAFKWSIHNDVGLSKWKVFGMLHRDRITVGCVYRFLKGFDPI